MSPISARRALRERTPRLVARFLVRLLLMLLAPAVAHAQTDYYNTDAGRPVRIEDAYAIERRAIELQVAPLRLERPRTGSYRWGIEPEVAIGLLPRLQLEIGLPLAHVESRRSTASNAPAGTRTTGIAGLEVSALYNLNAETRLPALALVADVVLPLGSMAPARSIPSLKAIATRTFPWARIHLNAQATFATASDVIPSLGATVPSSTVPSTVVPSTANAEFTRWMAGVAIDRTFPLRSLLLTAELVASAPLDAPRTRQWDAAGGTRYQLSPRIAVDAGGGYRFTGDDAGWFLTTGAAVAIGLPTFRAIR